MFDPQQARLLNTLDEAHESFYRAKKFSGPSAYFHLSALEAGRAQNFERFVLYSYAMLAAWGMHRMGTGGSKMHEFDDFRTSLRAIWRTALALQTKLPNGLTDADWTSLKKVFCGIRCMASSTSLVGNSKVMAHLLPNLVPPIDRQYTLKFLFGHGRIKNAVEREWATLQEVLTNFFYPIVASPRFERKAQEWLADTKWVSWDTSELKIVDNLVIGFMQMHAKPRTKK